MRDVFQREPIDGRDRESIPLAERVIRIART